MHPEVTPVPVGRIIAKLDSYLNKNDYDGAERHLRRWLSEAESSHDMRGKLTLLNEQIGIYRKTGKEQECLRAISDALSLVNSMDMEQSITYGTTLINAATGYKAFGKADVSAFALETLIKYYITNCPEDTDWVVLPVSNFDAYFGSTSFSKKRLTELVKSGAIERENSYNVSRYRINPVFCE